MLLKIGVTRGKIGKERGRKMGTRWDLSMFMKGIKRRRYGRDKARNSRIIENRYDGKIKIKKRTCTSNIKKTFFFFKRIRYEGFGRRKNFIMTKYNEYKFPF